MNTTNCTLTLPAVLSEVIFTHHFLPETREKVKILQLINTLAAGGAELHLLALCRYLRRQGLEVSVACLREQVKESRPLRPDFEREHIRVIDLQADNRYDWRFLGRLARLLKRERPDILHTHLPRADIAAALIHRLTYSPAFICSVHGIYRQRWFGPWAAPLMRWAYHEAEGVIAISAAVQHWLGQDLGVVADKVTVIHYGIEPEQFACPPMNCRGMWARQGQVIVGSLGRMEAGKGFDCLIRAISIVQRHLPDVLLLIAGHDLSGYRPRLQALIAKQGLAEAVRLMGFQSDVPSFLHALDAFAFASRSEGFGQVVIEAMAAGKPVVASRIPPLTEIVLDKETGLLVEPDDPQAFADAITWLCSHPAEARAMGQRGQERVSQQFSAEVMAVKTLSLYQRIARKGGTMAV
jgi:glycosyltransferase involved in cell wall biosynthesis